MDNNAAMTDTAVSGLKNQRADRVQNISPPPVGFRPDIEGLRAVAVLAVVLFHAGMPGIEQVSHHRVRAAEVVDVED